MFDEIFRDNDFSRRSSVCSCIGDDPELDEFMETYCDMLDRYRSDLARPFYEATTFLNNHRDGDYHRAVHIWIFAENTQQLLLQRRADCKDSWPGLWDISSVGHISAVDSSLTTARDGKGEVQIVFGSRGAIHGTFRVRRELQEELGLTLPDDAFVFLQQSVTNNGNFINNEFDDVYLVTPVSPPNSLIWRLLLFSSSKLYQNKICSTGINIFEHTK